MTSPAWLTTTEVDDQLSRYEDILSRLGIDTVRGAELQHWATEFPDYPHWYSIFPTVIYVWGVGLPPGHVYFTDDGDRVPAAARAKADQNEDNGNNEAQEGPPCLWCDPIPGVPEAPEIPVA